MTAIAHCLEALTLGQPTHVGRLAMFPLIADRSSGAAPYLLLDEALSTGQLDVSEVSDAGIVARLQATNNADRPVLLFDGEELKGAKQNRILNATILVPEKSELTLPVSCVEQGRWRYESRAFASSGEALFAKGRLRKAERMAAMRRTMQAQRANAGWRHADVETHDPDLIFSPRRDDLAGFDAVQHAVWRDVEEALQETFTPSASMAMHDSYLLRKRDIAELASGFEVSEAQVGAVFCIDGRPVGIEVAGEPTSFASIFGKLVRSYCLNALGRSAPHPIPASQAISEFVSSVQRLEQMVSPSVGLGEDVRLDGPDCCGSALLHAGSVLHLSVFSKAAFEPAR